MAVREESDQAQEPQGGDGPGTARPRSYRSYLSTEVVLESILLIFVGALFAFLLVSSYQWNPDTARMPRITGIAGLGFLAIFIYTKIKPKKKGAKARILDLGFDEVDVAQKEIIGRTIRLVGWLVGLFASVWLIGYHISIPLFVFSYLVFYAKVRLYWAVVAAVGFEVFIYGMYDRVLHSIWPEPVIPWFDFLAGY